MRASENVEVLQHSYTYAYSKERNRDSVYAYAYEYGDPATHADRR